MVFVNTLAGVKVLPKPVSAESSDSYKLSPEQLKFYDDNGYLVIKEFIDFASLYSYKQRFLQICKGIVPAGNIRVIKEPALAKQNLKPEDYINKLHEILYDDVFITYGEHPRMLSVLSQLIGDDITAVNSMFINKPPGGSRHPAHQDLFYFPFRPAEKIVGSWTAVDHVHYDNGCLFIVPGSHKAKQLYEHDGRKNTLKLYHGVDEEVLAPPEKQVQLEMSPGDTVFFSPYLIHGSGPNRTKTYRKAITFHFANSSCHYIDVSGTVQERVAKEIEALAEQKMGMKISYADTWRYKSRQVKGVRSNL
ncbi:phytanoyl-CoA dioxygenase, peroxisomal-like [Anticarsia gemmatalis]|uniref:phytanoyl-CoA dioxygenase, peroxisomal-like n=1 Tax=Anticarsia gemmatalis TaxID=129554 RepID=UPI003F76DF1F